LPITILRAVGVLESKLILFFSLLFEEEKDRILGEGFLEIEEAEILLEECLVIQQVWNLPLK